MRSLEPKLAILIAIVVGISLCAFFAAADSAAPSVQSELQNLPPLPDNSPPDQRANGCCPNGNCRNGCCPNQCWQGGCTKFVIRHVERPGKTVEVQRYSARRPPTIRCELIDWRPWLDRRRIVIV